MNVSSKVVLIPQKTALGFSPQAIVVVLCKDDVAR